MTKSNRRQRTDPEFRSGDDDEYEIGSRGQVGGAAIAGGLAGALLGGVVGGVVVAAGAAYLAANTEGEAGKLARKAGDTVNKVGNKIKRSQKKDDVFDKVGKTMVEGAQWAEKKLSSASKSSSNKKNTEANLSW